MSDTPAPRVPPSMFELFVAFALIALSGFGGVLYWSRRMMVEKRKWMTAEEFAQIFALCNFLPGGNIVNFSVVFGRQARGTPGALVALLGLLGPPFALVTFFGALYARYGDLVALQRMFVGVAAAAAGLTVSTVIKMAAPLLRKRPDWTHAVALSVFIAVGFMRWPIYWVLALLVPCSILLAWWTRR